MGALIINHPLFLLCVSLLWSADAFTAGSSSSVHSNNKDKQRLSFFGLSLSSTKNDARIMNVPLLLALSASSSSSSSESTSTPLSQRLTLEDRFDRWKFLQEFLDDDIQEDDTHELLFAVLWQGYQENISRKQQQQQNDKKKGFAKKDNDNGDDDKVWTATPEQKEILKDLVEAALDAKSIPALADEATLQQVQQLIPDIQEDEDAFKSSWDTVLELHGRETVKVNEEAGTARWKTLSIVSRVLIHYGFLLDGIILASSSSTSGEEGDADDHHEPAQ